MLDWASQLDELSNAMEAFVSRLKNLGVAARALPRPRKNPLKFLDASKDHLYNLRFALRDGENILERARKLHRAAPAEASSSLGLAVQHISKLVEGARNRIDREQAAFDKLRPIAERLLR